MLYREPHAGAAPILQVIDQARHAVSVGMYYLSDRPILRALQAAHARGVNVRVIVEGKPYGMKPWQVKKEERGIEATGATLHLAPYRFTSHGGQYAFYHAKYAAPSAAVHKVLRTADLRGLRQYRKQAQQNCAALGYHGARLGQVFINTNVVPLARPMPVMALATKVVPGPVVGRGGTESGRVVVGGNAYCEK
ncbi:hypothetical protein HF668_00360 [Acidithiobacillus ferridurans]|nr:hypothetical protein [Acidithiobacillus ferridurans]